VPYHASQMFAKNITTYLAHLVKDGQFRLDLDDEITRETLLCKDKQVLHPQVRQALGLGELLSSHDVRPPIDIE
jgi:NAD(P) transhydrogenase subunit alpha